MACGMKTRRACGGEARAVSPLGGGGADNPHWIIPPVSQPLSQGMYPSPLVPESRNPIGFHRKHHPDPATALPASGSSFRPMREEEGVGSVNLAESVWKSECLVRPAWSHGPPWRGKGGGGYGGQRPRRQGTRVLPRPHLHFLLLLTSPSEYRPHV